MINARAVGSGRLKLLFIPTALSTWTFRVALGCKREKKSLPVVELYVLSCIEVRGRRGQSFFNYCAQLLNLSKTALLSSRIQHGCCVHCIALDYCTELFHIIFSASKHSSSSWIHLPAQFTTSWSWRCSRWSLAVQSIQTVGKLRDPTI